jgi:hypothetical protein
MRNSGTTVFNETGANNGTSSGGITLSYANGVVGNGALLDGTNGVVSIGTSSLFDFTTSDFSASLWILTTAAQSGNNRIVSRGEGSVGGWEVILMTDNRARLATWQAAAGQSTYSTALGSNQWNHIVVLRSAASAVWYVNGVAATDSAGTHINPTSYAGGLFLGKYSQSNNFYLAGRIDEVRIYSRALSVDEIRQLYRMGALPRGIK